MRSPTGVATPVGDFYPGILTVETVLCHSGLHGIAVCAGIADGAMSGGRPCNAADANGANHLHGHNALLPVCGRVPPMYAGNEWRVGQRISLVRRRKPAALFQMSAGRLQPVSAGALPIGIKYPESSYAAVCGGDLSFSPFRDPVRTGSSAG